MEYSRKTVQGLQDLRTECINGRESTHCHDVCGCHTASPMFLEEPCQNQSEAADIIHAASHETSNKCLICEKTFVSHSVLKQHLLVHSKERPYTCKVCGKSFGRKGVLKRHLVTHSKEKPYHCELCGKGFTQKGSVVKHLVVHTGEKPYQCHKCKGSFTEKSNLLKHLRIVHKEKERYKCPKCDKRFAFKSQLTGHTNDAHITYDKSYLHEVVPLLPQQSCSSPPGKNFPEQDLEYGNSFKITTIGIPLTYSSAPPIIFDATVKHGTLYSERFSSRSRNEPQRLEGPVKLGINQEFSIQNLPKRSSIFIPLVLYTD